MSIEAVRDAIVATIAAQLPSLRTCAAHPGRFTLDELARVTFKTPAVHVAALVTGQQEQSGESINAVVSWCAYVTTESTSGVDRDLAAIRLVNGLLQIIDSNDWGSDDVVEDPANIKAQNLYSGTIDKTGVAMWAITWIQKIRLGETFDMGELDDFLRAIGESVNDDGMTLIESQTELEGTGNE